MLLVPVTQLASKAWIGLVLLGIVLGMAKLIMAGVVIFAVIALFQIVTLPVEFNASSRAKVQLLNLGIVQPQETGAISQVLSAAAMTYVAALIQALGQLLYFLSLARGQRN